MKTFLAIIEVFLLAMVIFGLMDEHPFILLAPLIPLGFYYEDKLIALEEKILRKWKCGRR